MIPRPYFDRLAQIYEPLERMTFGGLLRWCRTAHLSRFRHCRRALILGDGDGRFLADLLRVHATIEVDSLDISAGMIALARKRAQRIPGAAERVRFTLADASADPLPSTGYDLVITNFFLDCLHPGQIAAVIRQAAGACTPSALWVDGDFRVPPSGWARMPARLLLATMYGFFRLTTRLSVRTLTDPAPLLAAEGFRLAEEASRLGGFLTARLWVRGQTPIL